MNAILTSRKNVESLSKLKSRFCIFVTEDHLTSDSLEYSKALREVGHLVETLNTFNEVLVFDALIDDTNHAVKSLSNRLLLRRLNRSILESSKFKLAGPQPHHPNLIEQWYLMKERGHLVPQYLFSDDRKLASGFFYSHINNFYKWKDNISPSPALPRARFLFQVEKQKGTPVLVTFFEDSLFYDRELVPNGFKKSLKALVSDARQISKLDFGEMILFLEEGCFVFGAVSDRFIVTDPAALINNSYPMVEADHVKFG